MKRKEETVCRVGFALCEAFVLFTVVMLLQRGLYNRLLMAGMTALFLTLPWALSRWLGVRLWWPLHLFCLLYALGPMMGQCYNFYYKVWWWDRALHVVGGAVFALLGLLVYERFAAAGRHSRGMAAAFALCFSLAASMLWECGEFGADNLLGANSQDDTVITELRSYLLGSEIGVAGAIRDIREVTVNGVRLPVAGYIDIGLYDTMWDMLLGVLGAAVIAFLRLCGFRRWTSGGS